MAAFNIEIDDDLTDQVITALLSLGAAFGIYRNNYIGSVGRAQYRLFQDPEVQRSLEKALQMVQEQQEHDEDQPRK